MAPARSDRLVCLPTKTRCLRLASSLSFARASTDPELINHLAQNAYDAVSVTIQECDNTDCVMVDGFKTTDNSLVFSEGLGDRTDTYQKVMSMTMKDTE